MTSSPVERPVAPPYWRLRNRLDPTWRRRARRAGDAVAAPLVGSICGARRHRGAVGLTFDDGPDEGPGGRPVGPGGRDDGGDDGGATSRILDLLAAAGASATFFVLADRARHHGALVARIAAEGHEVALHGTDHTRPTTLPAGELRRRLAEGRDVLEQLTGARVRHYRPAYGAQSLRTWAAARRVGLDVVVWSVEGADWATADESAVAAAVLGSVVPGGVVLLHDRFDDAAPPGVERGDPVVTAALVLDGLAERGLAPVSVQSLVAAGGARRTAWFRP